MKRILILAAFFGAIALKAQTGNSGINTTNPKATLDVNLPSNYANGQLAGVAIPQLTGDQIEAMSASNPKTGTIVYATAVSTAATKDVTAVGYWYWKNTTDKWEPILDLALATSIEPWYSIETKAPATKNTDNLYAMGSVHIGFDYDFVKSQFGVVPTSYLSTKGLISSYTRNGFSGLVGITQLPSVSSGGHPTFEGYQAGLSDVEAYVKSSPKDPSLLQYTKANQTLMSVVGRDFKSINNFRNHNATAYGGASIYMYNAEDITDIAKGTFITFRTTKNGTIAEDERVRIDHNGNVGIGTIAPIEKLDVAGNIKSTNLAGTGNRTVVADANGVLRVGSDANNNTGWSLTGNTGTNPTSHYLGTTDSQPLNFKTNATTDTNPKMTILQNGNVGVNNSNPLSKLDIFAETSDTGYGSDISFTHYSTTSTAITAPSFNIYASRGLSSAPINLSNNDDMGHVQFGGYINGGKSILSGMGASYRGNGATLLSNLGFFTSSTPRMIIDENGNVGINNPTPTEKLDVNGNIKTSSLAGTGTRNVVADANGVLLVGSDANNNSGWSLTGNTGTSPSSNYVGTTDNQPLNFKTNATTDANPKMTILSNGNVGIGTTTPLSKLDIAGAAKADIHLSYRRNQALNDYPFFMNLSSYGGTFTAPEYVRKDDVIGAFLSRDAKSNLNSAGSNTYGGSEIYMRATENFTDLAKGSNMVFTTTSNGTIIGTERMRIDHNGNVGIGTTAPKTKLDVIGGISFANNDARTRARLYEVAGDEPTKFDREIVLDAAVTTAADAERTSIMISPTSNGALLPGTSVGRGRVQIEANHTQIMSRVILGVGVSDNTIPVEALEVLGNVKATGSFISGSTTLNVPDYVFQKYYTGFSSLKEDYRFPTLNETEDFIKEKGHLPGYPSAKEIKDSGNLDITQHTLTNQEKIEELYLHTIEQDKKLKEQDKQIATQQQTINELLKRLEALEKK